LLYDVTEEYPMTRENTSAAYGVYAEDVPVADVVRTLNDAGFNKEHICLMLARTHPIATIVREAGIRNADRKASAVAADLIEWLSEFGAVVIRTFGFFIRSQAFLNILVTSREAPALCGSSETLIGLGFSEEDAERLEEKLCEPRILVYVACSERGKATWAREVLQRIGAQETAELTLGHEIATAA
jgi:Heat induced stress protein YflT